MHLMAVDPSIHHCGVAIFEDERLVLLKTIAGEGTTSMNAGAHVIFVLDGIRVVYGITDIACERPWSYGQRYQHTWSLFGLADSVKELAEARKCNFAWYLPMEFLSCKKRRMVKLDAEAIEQETGICPKTTDEWVAHMLGRHHLGLMRIKAMAGE